MKIIFHAHCGKTFISKLIRLLSPKYNHISIQLENTIYEAEIGETIYPKSITGWTRAKTVVRSVEFEVSYETYFFVQDFLDDQIGKEYDYLGIFSFVWTFLRPQRGKWYCSELAMVALLKMLNQSPTDDDTYQRVSPYQFIRFSEVIHTLDTCNKKTVI